MYLKNIFNIFKPRRIDKGHVKILVIEDGEVDMRMVCALIERGGYTPLKAYNGKTGFEIAQREKPDLIILDYNLPDMQGPELCKVFKMHYDTEKIPVLFLTSVDTPDGVISCYEQGAENYFAKPISPRYLLKQIELTLKEKQLEP